MAPGTTWIVAGSGDDYVDGDADRDVVIGGEGDDELLSHRLHTIPGREALPGAALLALCGSDATGRIVMDGRTPTSSAAIALTVAETPMDRWRRMIFPRPSRTERPLPSMGNATDGAMRGLPPAEGLSLLALRLQEERPGATILFGAEAGVGYGV